MNETNINNVSVELTIRAGSTKLTVSKIKELAVGSILSIDSPFSEDEPFELTSNGQVLARGVILNIDGQLKFSITSLGE